MSTVTCLEHAETPGIATIMLNRPEYHNALDAEMVRLLLLHFQTLANKPSVRAVFLEGQGSTFCSGIDLSWMKANRTDHMIDNNTVGRQLAELLAMMHQFNKPIIALVSGPAFGGGLGLIACSDIAIATKSVTFCFSEVRLGLIPAVISPYVIGAIGARSALRYFLTGEHFDAVEAHRIGLVHEVISDRALRPTSMNIARALVAGGPCALSKTKQLVANIANKPLDPELIASTVAWISDIGQTAEAQEGVSAFLEKRRASWRTQG